MARKASLTYDVASRDVPREQWPGGRMKISLGTSLKTEAKRRRGELAKLRRWAAWDILRAVANGELHVANVVANVAQHGETAVALLRERLAEHRTGQTPTLDEESELYLAWYERKRAAKSLHQRTWHLRRMLARELDGRRPLGQMRMNEPSVADLDAVLTDLAGKLAPDTFNGYVNAISGLYTWSIRHEADAARIEDRAPRWSFNPASKIERRDRVVRVVTASEEQIIRLLAGAELYQTAYLRPLLHLGLREGELIHTRLHEDLDIRDWVWRIHEHPPEPRCRCAACQSHGWRPKAKHSYRVLHVPAQPAALRSSILRYLEHVPCEPGDYVFRNPAYNQLWRADAIAKDFARLCRRVDVRYGTKVPGGITPHSLRHTCATEMVRRGIRESVIAQLLGDTVDTIVRTYLHLTAEDVAEAVRTGPAYA